MRVYEGKRVSGGIAIGRIWVYRRQEQQAEPVKVSDVRGELLRFEAAKAEAARQLLSLYEKTLPKAGEAEAAIFMGQRMLAEDLEYNDFVKNIVCTRKVQAEYAVNAAAEYFSGKLEELDETYLRERAADVRDVSRRILAALGSGAAGEEAPGQTGILGGSFSQAGIPGGSSGQTGILGGGVILARMGEEPVILAAEELSPSETAQLDRNRILALVTVHGSQYSHAAILAGTMAVPALVGTPLPLDHTVDGKLAVVDGDSGRIYVEPDAEFLAEMTALKQKTLADRKELEDLKGLETVTRGGRRIRLYANLNQIGELAAVRQNDAEGIGLFRSEFLYLEREDLPTEEEQFLIYRQVAEAMEGRPVVIRTLDLGADKQCGYLGPEQEENPALGLRGIRMCLARPEIFRTQLRALFRASAYGKIGILYPMITSVGEVERIREITAQVKAELREQGFAWGEPEQGIMIETPAAALISDVLARKVDFFSIGTNDLTQYALAADRQDPNLREYYDPHHPAILRMIAMVVENAHKAGIRAGICGEPGADPALVEELLAMGVDELSMPPERILAIRRLVREMDKKNTAK